jgi:hypothetical protein
MTDTLTKKQREYLQDVNSALHEAGHLAAAISRGIPAIARIGYDGFSSARMNYDPIGVSLEDEVFLTFAGIAVVEKFHLRKLGLALDLEDIEKAVARLPVEEAEHLKAQARRDAEQFVANPLALGGILRLAIVLIERRSLDEEAAKKVFAGEVEASDEFCEAIRLLPRAIWQE